MKNESVGLWSEASCALHRDWTQWTSSSSGLLYAEFGPASVCTRGKPQLRLHEWWLFGVAILR